MIFIGILHIKIELNHIRDRYPPLLKYCPMSDYSQPRTMRTAISIATEYVAKLDDRANGSATLNASPFSELERVAPAWLHHNGLIIAAGRQTMGKTAFAQQLAEHVGLSKTALIYSLEMSSFEVIERSFSRRLGIPVHRLKDPTGLEDTDWSKVCGAFSEISATNLLVDDATFDINSLYTKTKATAYALKERDLPPLGLIVVDYLQLVTVGKRGSTRAEDIGTISRSLKCLARDIGAPVIALSQLNRAVEDRQNKRPTLSDLPESGSIEQDADLVLMIYRDEVYNRDTPFKGAAEVAVVKNRHGDTGVARLAWIPERVCFGNLAQSFGQPQFKQDRGGNGNAQDIW